MSDADAVATRDGPGDTLADARRELGVTLRDVSDALNIPIDLLEAIEANNFDKLPGRVFARGYVRAYAKLLELDPEPVLGALPELESEPIVDVVPTPRRFDWQGWARDNRWIVLGTGAAIALIAVISLISMLWPDSVDEPDNHTAALVDEREAPEDLESQAPPRTDDAISAASDPELIADDTRSTSESDTVSGTMAGSASSAASATDNDEPLFVPSSDMSDSAVSAPVAAATLSPEPVPTPRGVRRITPTGEDLLEFRFSGDCWLEVKNAQGRMLHSSLNNADGVRRLIGQGPFRVLLGYAPGVQLTFNGDPVALAPHTNNNVATLVLGQ